MEMDGDNVAMVKLNRPTTAASHAESHAELPMTKVKPTPPELPSTDVYKKAERAAAPTYVELGTKSGYHEMPSNTVSSTTPQQAHPPVSPKIAIYPSQTQSPLPSTPSTPGYPGYNYQRQQYPPPTKPSPPTWQQYPGPPPPNMFPASYVPPPPPPNPPSPGSPYRYAPHQSPGHHQSPGQIYQPHPIPTLNPLQRTSLHEMA
ncbi:hypothetical protein L211DRAFT_293125 [Terfezia boudieri ATCC MYA-4762]|uniref:Uncharacterized protein n=1 Tax=Terfezia boudieri ATCC MYA-4762 TaxID=1051890 RepID=A0A3N4LJF6_9PEZI|nr:hypothetical protein L211DRAFT_293125 [Terfezia boudieri ATCC MYA-4762]